MYPPHHLGGYELMWRSAVAHHRAAGHEVRVLTTDWREPYVDASTPEDADVHRELRWYWHDHDFPRIGMRARLALERHNVAVLDRHLEAFAPDAIAWWAMGGMSLSLIERAATRGVPGAAIVVDDWLLYGPKVDGWWRILRRRARRLEGACHWVFASQTLRARAREAGFDSPRAEVAHPGIDLAIEALSHLPPETALRIVGRGDEAHLGQLRELVERLDLAERVSFERLPRGDLPAAYASADALLFPVRWIEPFGLVPLEAMACGTPVIASGRGGSGEYLSDGENCVLFDVDGGGPALAAAVERLAGDPALRERLVRDGRTDAQRFTDTRFNDAVLAALETTRPASD